MLKYMSLSLILFGISDTIAHESMIGTVDFYKDNSTHCYYYRFDNGFCERYIIACPEQVIRQENCDDNCNCETFILKKKVNNE